MTDWTLHVLTWVYYDGVTVALKRSPGVTVISDSRVAASLTRLKGILSKKAYKDCGVSSDLFSSMVLRETDVKLERREKKRKKSRSIMDTAVKNGIVGGE